MASNILVAGGSRHIGYYASLRFLDVGATVTFLLRSTAVFDADEAIQKYVKTGHVRLVKGDALVIEDVRNAWAEASKDKPVDLLLFTIGFTGTPKFSITKGLTMSPANLSTQTLLNFICTIPKATPPPKVIALSTTGVSRSSRAKQALLMKFLYGYLILQIMKDKLGMERAISHCAGWTWNENDGEPSEEIMGTNWKEREGLPEPGSLKEAVVIRAGQLTDGECLGDSVSDGKQAYRVAEGDFGGSSVSRKDVAHLVFDLVTNRWGELGGKQVSVVY